MSEKCGQFKTSYGHVGLKHLLRTGGKTGTPIVMRVVSGGSGQVGGGGELAPSRLLPNRGAFVSGFGKILHFFSPQLLFLKVKPCIPGSEFG